MQPDGTIKGMVYKGVPDFDGKILIGITGGIGSGKSTVSAFFASSSQLPLLNIDGICAKLIERGNAGWLELKKNLDDSFFCPDESLDRRRLRRALFSETALRQKINSLIHPLAFEAMLQEVKACAHNTVIVDVPLLYEAGWQVCFEHAIVVYAEHDTCCRRIMKRDQIEQEEAERTIRSQLPLAEKVLLADHVINNDGCIMSTMLEVNHLVRFLKCQAEESSISLESS